MPTTDPLLATANTEPKPKWGQLATVCYVPSSLCFFNFGLGLLGLPLVCKHWNIPVATVAYLKTVAEIAETAFSIPASSVAIRLGAKGAVLVGTVLYTLTCLGLTCAPGFAVLAAGYFFQSGSVKIFNRGRGIIMKDVPKTSYGQTQAILILLRCVFMSVAPVCLDFILKMNGNPQNIFWIQAGLGALMMLSIGADCTPAPDAAKPKKNKVQAQTTAGSSENKEVTYGDMLSGKCRAVLVRTVGLCACISMLLGGRDILLPVASLSLGIPLSQISVAMTICYGTAGMLSIAGGGCIDKFGKRSAMLAAAMLSTIAFAVLGMLSTVEEESRGKLLLVPAITFGVAEAFANPLKGVLKNGNADTVKAWASENGRDEKAAIAKSFGLLDVLNDFVGCFYPIALGLCATYFSAEIASCWFAVVGVLCAIWASTLQTDLN